MYIRYDWFKTRLIDVNPGAFELEEGGGVTILHVRDCEKKDITRLQIKRHTYDDVDNVIIEWEELSMILSLVGLELQYIQLGRASNIILARGMGGGRS